MTDPIPWLEEKLREAEDDLLKAKTKIEFCTEMLKIAISENRGNKYKMTMYEHMEKIFYREKKELSSSELCRYLNNEGRNTNRNSVNTQLSRHKNKFERQESGKWFLKNPLMGR